MILSRNELYCQVLDMIDLLQPMNADKLLIIVDELSMNDPCSQVLDSGGKGFIGVSELGHVLSNMPMSCQ